MKSVLLGLPAFVGRNWLRVIIIGAALVLISRKQINFNVRLGAPVPVSLPTSNPAGGEGPISTPQHDVEPAELQTAVDAQHREELPSDEAADGPSFLSRLFGGGETDPLASATPTDGIDRVVPKRKGVLQSFSLFGGGGSTPSLLRQLEETSEDDIAAFVRRFSHVAQSEREKYGIPASITLASGLLQSGAGTRVSAQEWNNYFALPCAGDWDGPCRSLAGKRMRQYETAWLSFRNHSIYITSGRFAPMRQFGPRDYQNWAAGLAELGFNDTANLAEQLLETINRYELHRFD